MNTKALIIGGGLVGLFMLYKLKLSSNNPNSRNIGAPKNSLGATPQNQNATQPWYTGALTWARGQAENYAQNPTATLQASSSVVHSLSDISGTVSNWFGGSSSGQTAPMDGQNAQTQSTSAGSSDDLPALTDPSTDLTASTNYGSTWVGDLTTDQALQVSSPQIMSINVDNSTIDNSDADSVGAETYADNTMPDANYDATA